MFPHGTIDYILKKLLQMKKGVLAVVKKMNIHEEDQDNLKSGGFLSEELFSENLLFRMVY